MQVKAQIIVNIMVKMTHIFAGLQQHLTLSPFQTNKVMNGPTMNQKPVDRKKARQRMK